MRKHSLVIAIFLLNLLIISLITTLVVAPGFEHARTTMTKTFNQDDVTESLIYGDKEFFNWNYSIPGEYSYNSTEIEVSGGNAHLLLNQSGSAGEPIYLKIVSEDYYEILSKRTQNARHFYNATSQKYHFTSAQNVFKPGIYVSTNWITFDEYPIRYIVRLRNTSIRFFNTPTEISNFITSIDKNMLWGVGIESYNGVLAFYLNLIDENWGHAQYLYYPRLKNGKLVAYNQPQYAIYPHIFAKVGATWFDQLLNNKSLYTVANDPRDNLNFQINGDEIGLYYETLDFTIQGFQWDFRHGFKYNSTDKLFHLITEFRCLERGFDDIGMAYEVVASPQSFGTPFEVEEFLLRNETHEITIDVTSAWNAGAYLQDFYSQIEIISANKEAFTLDFQDMENAGFTEKYLQLQDQILPNDESYKTLRAGMYGFGAYSQNQWINIDPTFSEKQNTDAYDFIVWWNLATSWVTYTGYDYLRIGYMTGQEEIGMMSWDTGINETIYSIGNSTMTCYAFAETMESGEYIAIGLYDSEDDDHIWNETEASVDDQGAFEETTYWNQTDWWTDPSLGTNTSFDVDYLLANWSEWHNNNPSDREFLPMKFWAGDGLDPGTEDRNVWYESSRATVAQRPTLTFDYTLAPPVNPPELDSPSDKDLPYSFSGESLSWIPTERDNSPDNYVIYRNGSNIQDGSWSNQSAITISLDDLSTNQGIYNYTCYINDTNGLSASDEVIVTVANPHFYYRTNPSITTLINFTYSTTLELFNATTTEPINTTIKYQLALNNQFKFWNVSQWDNITTGQSNNYYIENESTSEININTYLDLFASSGNLSVRAFLHNEYNSTPILDHIAMNTINTTSSVEGVFHERLQDNSFNKLGFNFDYYTVDFYIELSCSNFTTNDMFTFRFLYLLPGTYNAYINSLVLYSLTSIDTYQTTFEHGYDTGVIETNESETHSRSLANSYAYRDLIILVEANQTILFNAFMTLEIVWYKKQIEIQQNFVEGIFAFDDIGDFPIFLVLFPFLLILSGDMIIAFAGLVILIVEILALIGVLRVLKTGGI